MKPQKIYLAFTVLGDRSKHELVNSLASVLHQRGHRILTAHLLNTNAVHGEAMLSPKEVFLRDMKWLEECDSLVAEVSNPSAGVSFEIGYLLGIGRKKVYILYDKNVEQNITKMFRGNTMKNCVLVPYFSIQDIYKFVEENF